MKKFVSLAAAVCVAAAGMGAFAAQPSDFKDIPDNWAHDAVVYAIENDILQGEDGMVYPERNLRRAELAAIINRVMSYTETADISTYTDVPESAWYHSDMAKAVGAGVFSGYDNKLSPEANITREEVFSVIQRAYGFMVTDTDLSQFTDADEVSGWAASSAAALVQNGVISGSNGKLNPKANITRAELAQIIYSMKPSGEIPEGDVLYATVDMPYADFYYGELGGDDISLLDTYKSDGYYDAVSSATVNKISQHAMAYGEQLSDKEYRLYGIKNVPVSVSRELYDAAVNGEADNAVSEQIAKFKNITNVRPASYKVLRSDGTYGALTGEKTEFAVSGAAVATDAVWGDYKVNLKEDEIAAMGASKDTLIGVILTTDDGKRYALRHSQNLYVKSYEFAWSVGAKTSEPHGNALEYAPFEDMEGKTVTGIEYIINDNGNFKAYTLTGFEPIFCKYKLAKSEIENAGIVSDGADIDTENGTIIEVVKNVPSDANYEIASVTYLGEAVEFSAEGDDTVKISGDANKIGTYTVLFTDDKYENVTVTFDIKGSLKQEEITLTDGQLAISNDSYPLSDYVKQISSVTVAADGEDGTAYTATGKKAVVIIKEDGSVDAEIKSGENNVFEAGKSYTLTIKAGGYDDFTFNYTVK